MRRLAILGSTGSIGRSTLDVVERLGDIDVVGLAARSSAEALIAQVDRWRPKVVAVEESDASERVRARVPVGTTVLGGPDALSALASIPELDIVLVAVVGAAGLRPTLAALEAGHDVALANKETLVAGGEIVTRARDRSGARLVPVDSEHSAIFQCLAGEDPGAVKRLILTASGGPFLRRSIDDLARVTVEEALAHPTWNMGPKVTVDSATLMNKGLEIIEAHWLFDVDPAHIDVVIHPQSLIHSMVEFVDGSIMAQLATPDMRGPIQYALTAPRRRHGPVIPVEWNRLTMTFEQPDPVRYPSLALAREALRLGGTAPASLNAANEVAVSRFLTRGVAFTDIAAIAGTVLARHAPRPAATLEAVLEADRWARREATAASPAA